MTKKEFLEAGKLLGLRPHWLSVMASREARAIFIGRVNKKVPEGQEADHGLPILVEDVYNRLVAGEPIKWGSRVKNKRTSKNLMLKPREAPDPSWGGRKVEYSRIHAALEVLKEGGERRRLIEKSAKLHKKRNPEAGLNYSEASMAMQDVITVLKILGLLHTVPSLGLVKLRDYTVSEEYPRYPHQGLTILKKKNPELAAEVNEVLEKRNEK